MSIIKLPKSIDKSKFSTIKSPKPIDKNKFSRTLNDPEIYYGLPKDVKFCSKCTYSNQKPNSEKEYKHIIKTKKPTLNFDKKNVCGMSYFRKKKEINWTKEKRINRIM